jgi:uncharacterized protein involved in exopolysaccharide biosynthesis
MSVENTIDLRIFMAILRRRWLLIAIFFLVLMGSVITAISFIKEEFTAEARVLLDKKLSGAVLETSQASELGLDKAAIESEIELLHSQTVMDSVIELLAAAPAVVPSSTSSSAVDDLMQKYKDSLLGMTEKKSQALFFKEQATGYETRFEQYQSLLKGLAVSRVGDSYVLRITYTANTPDLAAQMANAFADAYIKEQRRVLATKSDQTLSWFQNKMDELKKMAQKADKSVADFRLRYNTQGSDATLNQLNVLVKESETYNQILNDYLDRYQTMNQESSYPVSESRVISQALPPPNRSHPQTAILLGVASIVALGLGIILALFVDLNEKSIRRAGQLRAELTIPFIGFVPKLGFWQKIKTQPLKINDDKSLIKEQQVYALQNPQSDYTLAVRGMAAHISQFAADSGVRLGMTNMDSSAASRNLIYNLSEYLAMGKAKCLYIDTNFIYSKDGNHQNKGWVNLLAGEISLEDVLLKSPYSGLHILPAGYAENIQTVSSLSSDVIKNFFQHLSGRYDYILVNLPDLKNSADLQIITPHLDACFINLKWGKSTLSSTQFYLYKSGIPAKKILGALLSDTHLGKLKRHYGYDA